MGSRPWMEDGCFVQVRSEQTRFPGARWVSLRQGCRRLAIIASLAASLLGGAAYSAHAQNPWKLVWSDEFDGQLGAPPDASKWKFQTGNGAAIAGNDEAEVYCGVPSDAAPCKANQPNAYLDGKGHLVLVAVRTDQTVTVGTKKIVSPVYTSARLNSMKDFRYGRLEASMRIPAAGKGIWPAFWAMSRSDEKVHWPATGEIDVMEQWNPTPGTDTLNALTIHGAVHGPKTPGSAEGYLDQADDYNFPNPPSNGLHQYAVDWSPGEVDFYVDGYLYERRSVATLTGQELWEQDRGPFYLLLNLAMGGGFFGYPDAKTEPTPTMVLDYVRVYQRDDSALPKGWGNYDAGGPAIAGSSLFSNGIFTVSGSGAGIAGHFDQFQYAYRGLGGDGEVTAHVLDQTSKVAQAKAGVMVRDGRGAASIFAMTFISPDGSVHFRYRTTKGDVPSDVPYKGQASWVKVGRVGEVFTGYASADGKTWTAIGNTKLPMPHDATAGLIATARDNRAPNVVRFDYVDVTRTDAGYDGVAVTLPGVLQAESFDTGGMGYSFSNEFGEAGPEVRQIAPAAGADDGASGYYLSGIKANRYINYSISVEKDGEYALTARVANAGAGGALHLNVDQKPLSKPLPVPDTGGTSHWVEMKAGSAHLTVGHHTVALVTDAAGSSGVAADVDFIKAQPQ